MSGSAHHAAFTSKRTTSSARASILAVAAWLFDGPTAQCRASATNQRDYLTCVWNLLNQLRQQ